MMKRPLLDRLQRRWGRFAVPNLTALLIAGQVAVFCLTQADPQWYDRLVLVPAKVLQGQWWRLLTVLFMPPLTHLLWAFFFWYMLLMMGRALEVQWGAFRYNVYVLSGYAATTAAVFLTPQQPATNGFLYGSIFLAFAHLFPDFELLLFFILPVKVKWLALLAWIGYCWALLTGNVVNDLAVLAAMSNYLLFFGRDIVSRMRSGHRRMQTTARQVTASAQPFHCCRVCGVTDKSDPQMEFRYCSKCAGTCCYCREHLHQHEHVLLAEEATPRGGANDQ